MSLAPTSVWIIVEKDRSGNPRGVEKVPHSRFYMTQGEAESTLITMPFGWMVAEVVMMGRPEFNADYDPDASQRISALEVLLGEIYEQANLPANLRMDTKDMLDLPD